jgi:hypothetical protein
LPSPSLKLFGKIKVDLWPDFFLSHKRSLIQRLSLSKVDSCRVF